MHGGQARHYILLYCYNVDILLFIIFIQIDIARINLPEGSHNIKHYNITLCKCHN